MQLYGHLLEGLDVSKAMAQPKTAYKVRHLKMGVRLAVALLQCDDYIALGLMVGFCSTEMMRKKSTLCLYFFFLLAAHKCSAAFVRLVRVAVHVSNRQASDRARSRPEHASRMRHALVRRRSPRAATQKQ